MIGAGTMGAGIAGEFARAGCEVRLVDRSDDFLERGMARLRG
ncbi:MAG: 3-hydroxyacyl-CoA dehydrogenase NAD-binding domain-containing protein, partial [Candidatus Brocadiia bacterium]|nr:3-hydroxyacyl-CoA dehydrogenase NAD-binding domain-containing protein [Candidatus Brocadiia bacterium]